MLRLRREKQQTERALQESAEQLRLITDHLPVLITYMDSDQRFRFLNKTAESWYGRPAADILDRSVKEIFGASAYKKLKAKVEEVLSGKSVTFEEVVDYPDGNARAVEVTYVPDVAEDGRVRGYFGLVADIAERKRAEEAVCQSERIAADAHELLMDAIESSPDGIALYDADDRLVVSNEKFRTGVLSGIADLIVPGVAFEELLRAAVDRGLVDIPDGDIEAYVRERLAHHRGGEGSLEVKLANGRWMLSRERRMRGGGIIGARSDITHRKRAAERLRESEERLGSIVENSPAAIFLKDMKGRYRLVNRKFEEWYGLSAADVLG